MADKRVLYPQLAHDNIQLVHVYLILIRRHLFERCHRNLDLLVCEHNPSLQKTAFSQSDGLWHYAFRTLDNRSLHSIS